MVFQPCHTINAGAVAPLTSNFRIPQIEMKRSATGARPWGRPAGRDRSSFYRSTDRHIISRIALILLAFLLLPALAIRAKEKSPECDFFHKLTGESSPNV